MIERTDVQRNKFQALPALSFVPEARAPPNGCWPTTAPVGLSLSQKLPAECLRILSAVTRASRSWACLLYTSDAADGLLCVVLGGSRINKSTENKDTAMG